MVTIGLQQPTYVASEGDILPVCVELQGVIERSITMSMVVNTGSSATGRYNLILKK